MKKIILPLTTFFATSLVIGQITLQHSFNPTEVLTAYSRDETIYVSFVRTDNKLKIYNADFSLRKTITVPIPANYTEMWANGDGEFSVSKHLFNTDDKYEFLVTANYRDSNNKMYYKLLLINEDGELIKDFHPNAGTVNFRGYTQIFHDKTNNVNKFIVNNSIAENWEDQFDVYSLPTSELTNRETKSINKLTAFPIPTKSILKINNPKNNSNKVEVFAATGKLVIAQSFAIQENLINVNVENLPKGVYVYKIGELSSKFIKE